jgi:hypothetical protein
VPYLLPLLDQLALALLVLGDRALRSLKLPSQTIELALVLVRLHVVDHLVQHALHLSNSRDPMPHVSIPPFSADFLQKKHARGAHASTNKAITSAITSRVSLSRASSCSSARRASALVRWSSIASAALASNWELLHSQSAGITFLKFA